MTSNNHKRQRQEPTPRPVLIDISEVCCPDSCNRPEKGQYFREGPDYFKCTKCGLQIRRHFFSCELTANDLQAMLHGDKMTAEEKTTEWKDKQTGEVKVTQSRLMFDENYKVKRVPKLKGKEPTREQCPKCGAGILMLITRFDGQKWYGCSSYPTCRYHRDYVPHKFDSSTAPADRNSSSGAPGFAEKLPGPPSAPPAAAQTAPIPALPEIEPLPEPLPEPMTPPVAETPEPAPEAPISPAVAAGTKPQPGVAPETSSAPEVAPGATPEAPDINMLLEEENQSSDPLRKFLSPQPQDSGEGGELSEPSDIPAAAFTPAPPAPSSPPAEAPGTMPTWPPPAEARPVSLPPPDPAPPVSLPTRKQPQAPAGAPPAKDEHATGNALPQPDPALLPEFLHNLLENRWDKVKRL